MKSNSLQAYFDESNQRKFNSHKSIIFRELKRKPDQCSYQIAHNLGLTNEATKKRLSELLNEGSIEVNYSFYYIGNKVSFYRIKEQLTFFCDRKPTLRTWLKDRHNEILKEYDLLFN